jgi:hypothetical protein
MKPEPNGVGIDKDPGECVSKRYLERKQPVTVTNI